MIVHQAQARLQFGFTVSFAWTDQQKLNVEWEPELPRITAARARRKFFDAYCRERNAFMADVATMRGHTVIVVSATGHADMDGFDVVEPSARH